MHLWSSPAKDDLPTDKIARGKQIDVNEHRQKQESSILCSFDSASKLKFSIFASAKQNFPMNNTERGIQIDFRELH
jgi:hypothetical protein